MITERQAIRPGTGSRRSPRNSAGRLATALRGGGGGRGHPSSCVCAVDSRSVTPPPRLPQTKPAPAPRSRSHTSAHGQPDQIKSAPAAGGLPSLRNPPPLTLTLTSVPPAIVRGGSLLPASILIKPGPLLSLFVPGTSFHSCSRFFSEPRFVSVSYCI